MNAIQKLRPIFSFIIFTNRIAILQNDCLNLRHEATLFYFYFTRTRLQYANNTACTEL